MNTCPTCSQPLPATRTRAQDAPVTQGLIDVAEFLELRTIRAPKERVPTADVVSAYRTWSVTSGRQRLSAPQFGKAAKALGLTVYRSHGGRFYDNLALWS